MRVERGVEASLPDPQLLSEFQSCKSTENGAHFPFHWPVFQLLKLQGLSQHPSNFTDANDLFVAGDSSLGEK